MKQGEVWLRNLDPTIGAEIKKTRPAVIVNADSLGKLPLKIIVPITDWKDKYSVAPGWPRLIMAPAMGWQKIPLQIVFRFGQFLRSAS